MLAVGSILSGSEFDLAPIGTAVQGEFGARVKLEQGEKWLHVESGHIGGLDQLGTVYKVTYLPPVDLPEVNDPIGDLADELWVVRNEALIGTQYEYQLGRWDEETEKVYRAMAQFVLDREPATDVDVPNILVDRDGDTWVLRDNGLYDLRFSDGVWAKSEIYKNKTQEQVRETYGTDGE